MSLLKIAAASIAPIVLAGCMTGEPVESRSALPGSARAGAELRNVRGQVVARASAEQSGDAIRIRLEATGMPRGTYAAHVHTTGSCAPPDYTSAGPHWNPTGAQHGKNNPAGMHKGDLPNLSVGTDGRGDLEYLIPAANLSGGPSPLLDGDGAALVVHASPDDYRTDPAGNAGTRIACGVFR